MMTSIESTHWQNWLVDKRNTFKFDVYEMNITHQSSSFQSHQAGFTHSLWRGMWLVTTELLMSCTRLVSLQPFCEPSHILSQEEQLAEIWMLQCFAGLTNPACSWVVGSLHLVGVQTSKSLMTTSTIIVNAVVTIFRVNRLLGG